MVNNNLNPARQNTLIVETFASTNFCEHPWSKLSFAGINFCECLGKDIFHECQKYRKFSLGI